MTLGDIVTDNARLLVCCIVRPQEQRRVEFTISATCSPSTLLRLVDYVDRWRRLWAPKGAHVRQDAGESALSSTNLTEQV